MARDINRIRAEGAAWRLIRDYCIDSPGPTPVEDIAMDSGVLCLEGKLTGCLARLVRKGRRGVVRTNSNIREDGRRRFAIAHELGHWFLHESESQMFICTADDMRDYKGSPMEVEANIFASEFLMPTALFKPLSLNAEPLLSTISSLAKVFNTSLTATAMRFVDLNRHESILVLSSNGKVVWSKQKQDRSGLPRWLPPVDLARTRALPCCVFPARRSSAACSSRSTPLLPPSQTSGSFRSTPLALAKPRTREGF